MSSHKNIFTLSHRIAKMLATVVLIAQCIGIGFGIFFQSFTPYAFAQDIDPSPPGLPTQPPSLGNPPTLPADPTAPGGGPGQPGGGGGGGPLIDTPLPPDIVVGDPGGGGGVLAPPSQQPPTPGAPQVQTAPNPNSDPTATNESEAPNDLSCESWTFTGGVDFTCILAHIANAIFWVGSVIVGLAGTILNFVILETILRMGYNVNNIAGIVEAWVVLRDLANIVFVFALLVIGIETILGTNRFGAKRLLVTLIIAALLVNFSLYFTKVIIDVTNLMSKEIYEQINVLLGVPEECSFQSPLFHRTDCVDKGLSGELMNQLRLTSLHSSSPIQYGGPAASAGFNWSSILTISAVGFIFLMITAFVFFAAAFMLLARFVILIALMIFSPLAFAASVLPKTQGYASTWWSTLFNQAFFAPAFFLMIWISFRIFVTMRSTPSFQLGTEDGLATALLGGDPQTGVSSILIVFNFAIIIAFLILSLVVASKLGAYGAKGAISTGRSLSRWAGGRTAGAPLALSAYGMQRVLGGTASRLADNQRLQKTAADTNTNRFSRYFAKQAIRGSDYASRASFDARNVGGVGKKLKLGESRKDGYAGRVERVQKSEKEFGERLAKGVAPTKEEGAQLGDLEQRRLTLQSTLANSKTEYARLASSRDPNKERKMAALQTNIDRSTSQLTANQKEIAQIGSVIKDRGEARKLEYANTLEKSGGTSHLFAGNVAGKRQAASELRKGKSKLDKARDAFKELGIEEAVEAAPQAPPAQPSASPTQGQSGQAGQTGQAGSTTP